MNFKVTLGMITGGADFRRLCSHNDMPAVAALPYLYLALFKNSGCLYVLKQGAVSFLVVLFDFPYKPEFRCKFRKPFRFCCKLRMRNICMF